MRCTPIWKKYKYNLQQKQNIKLDIKIKIMNQNTNNSNNSINNTEVVRKKFSGLLSLSNKARSLEAGEAKAESAIKSQKAKLIIVTEDASDNTKKKFSDMAAYRSIPIICIGDRYETGRCIGREFAVTCCITNEGFAKKMIELYNEIDLK